MRRKPASHPGLGREAAQLVPDPGLWPRSPAGGTVDDAEERAERQLEPLGDPRGQLLPPPVIHPNLSATAALAVSDKQRPAARVQIALVEIERLLNPQLGPP